MRDGCALNSANRAVRVRALRSYHARMPFDGRPICIPSMVYMSNCHQRRIRDQDARWQSILSQLRLELANAKSYLAFQITPIRESDARDPATWVSHCRSRRECCACSMLGLQRHLMAVRFVYLHWFTDRTVTCGAGGNRY